MSKTRHQKKQRESELVGMLREDSPETTRSSWLTEIDEDVRAKLKLLGCSLGYDVSREVVICLLPDKILRTSWMPVSGFRRARREITPEWWNAVLNLAAEANRLYSEHVSKHRGK